MNSFGQAQDLGDGLQLRQATPADAAALGRLIAEVHYDTLGQSIENMVSGKHPTVHADDFLLIEDLNNDKKIAASSGLMGNTFSYAGIPFKGAYIEAVATDPAYRRRGLMRKIIEAAHALSTQRGQMLQLVAGIRWFYRRFGYEYALEGPGHREFPLVLTPPLDAGEIETFQVRRAIADDVPALMQLYEREREGKLVTRSRPEALWRYHLTGEDQSSLSEMYYTVLDNEDEIAAYYGTWADFPWGSRFIRELSVRKGLPISAVLPAIQRFVQQQVKDNLADYGPTPPVTIQFDLGYQKDHQHPANLAMDSALTPYRPWEWYVRVADLPGFLVHIGPELERRLAESSMNGYEGDLKISFYQGGIRLLFDHGKLTLAEHWTSPELDEGHDAAFPDRTFLQLLFGFRSLDDLQYAFPDCWTNQQGKLLLNALFPKQPSWINY